MAGDDDALKLLARAVERIEELLDRLPLPAGKDLRERVATLRTVMLDKRPPALVLIGRRGAGKSSLINALFGAKMAELGHVTAQTGRGRWYDYERAGGAMSILDTRGVQEGSPPAEGDPSQNALESIAVELRVKAPDIVVFVVKASDVDSAIDGDLDAVEQIYEALGRVHHAAPPLVCVVTHCDLLEPKATRLHRVAEEPSEDAREKLQHVRAAELAVARKLDARARLRDRHVATLGVSAYMSWREDSRLRADERWHIEDLAVTLFRYLPDAGRAELARATQVRAVQEELVATLTKATAAVCAGVAVAPIPVADIVPLTALQAGLVAGIAWVGGRSVDRRGATEFMTGLGANVGLAFALREGFRALMKVVAPAGGPVVSATIAFSATMAIGAAARAYYIEGASLEQARRVFARRGAKDTTRPAKRAERPRDDAGTRRRRD